MKIVQNKEGVACGGSAKEGGKAFGDPLMAQNKQNTNLENSTDVQ